MNLISRICTNVLFAAALLPTGNAVAGPGHDHGDAPAVVTTGKASPRFEAHSDLFEVVGILGAGELSIFIDRYPSNQPMLDAKVELESGSTKLASVFHVDHGDYSFAAKPFENPGAYPITLTITAGGDVDILAGNLIVPAAEAAHTHANGFMTWKSWAAIGAVVVGIGIVFILFVRRRTGRGNHV